MRFEHGLGGLRLQRDGYQSSTRLTLFVVEQKTAYTLDFSHSYVRCTCTQPHATTPLGLWEGTVATAFIPKMASRTPKCKRHARERVVS